jgi:GDP-4-dehydro-6-deoxy-D-mannose reductase
VYHLAAFSSVKDSFEQERRVYDVNFYGTLNLLSSLAGARTKARVLMVSSGQVYGQGSSILTEQSLLCPRTPYAVSKAAAEFLAVRFWNANSLETIRVRPFNHVGPGQSAAFVCSDFARQVAEIELGLRTPEIYVGNLSVKRDFTDVRDVCRAYVLLLSNGIPGEVYNLASGRVSTIATILEILRTFCSCQIRVVKTGAKLRTAEIIELKASAAKMQALTGWEPEYTLETTLRDLYTWWLAKLKHQRPAAVLP